MEENPLLSIICPSNNQTILENDLLKSLKKQTYKSYELIIVDSKKEGFSSASEALNYGASLAKGEFLLFVHQDIVFIEANALSQLVEYSLTLDFGIMGVAGAIGKEKFKVASTVLMTNEKIQAGAKNEGITSCYALDECLLLCKKQSFKRFEDLGKTWHFYAVEYSAKCLENKENVLIVPIWILHDSYANSLDYSYFDTLLRYCKTHKNRKVIRTCCGYFNNNKLLPLYCLYRKIKIFVKRVFRPRKH